MTPSLISEFIAREQSAQQKSRGGNNEEPLDDKSSGLAS